MAALTTEDALDLLQLVADLGLDDIITHYVEHPEEFKNKTQYGAAVLVMSKVLRKVSGADERAKLFGFFGRYTDEDPAKMPLPKFIRLVLDLASPKEWAEVFT